MTHDPEYPPVGYYKTRLSRHGVWVPARVYRSCACSIFGGENNEPHERSSLCDRSGILVINVDGRIYDYGDYFLGADQMISKEQYDYMESDSEWCERHAPKDYKMRPREAVDFTEMKPLY